MECLKTAGFFFLASRRIYQRYVICLFVFFILACRKNKYRLSFSFTVVTALGIVCLVSLPLQIAMVVIGECKQT